MWGYLKLIELGLEDCVENIDAQRVFGYALLKNGKTTWLSYPSKKIHSDVSGRSFHNGCVKKLHLFLSTGANKIFSRVEGNDNGLLAVQILWFSCTGDFSCTVEVQRAITTLKMTYGYSIHRVLHVGPDTCFVVSRLLKEKDTEAWGCGTIR